MKKLILIGACLFLTSCFNRNLELTSSPPIVVDKSGNGTVASPYKIKIFYGKHVETYNLTYNKDFDKINVGDTLKNFRVF